MAEVNAPVKGLSIVCVFNDPAVRVATLDRSIEAYRGPVEVDYLPIDNTAATFASAGAALNHGARRARHDIVVFVHQDVHLHSIDVLAAAGARLASGDWALLGASGVSADGRWRGRMRDRVEVVGVGAPTPVDVDSLDELLFMARRETVLAEPLSEDPDLAWHAYCVEYGLRMRGLGRRVGAVDLAVTHNSLTTNLARLDEAHRRVAELHPALMPSRTTCGTVGEQRRRLRDAPVLRDHAWRARWLVNSVDAAGIQRRTGLPVVLADIRHDVDAITPADLPVIVINLDATGGFVEHGREPLTLPRYARPVTMCTVSRLSEVVDLVADWEPARTVVVTNLADGDLAELVPRLPRRTPWVLGRQGGDSWLLGGPAAADLPPDWRTGPSVPLGQRPRRPAPALR